MNESLTWVPVVVIAREYEKSPQMIRNWIRSGFILELGFMVKRDVTGHFKVGVPDAKLRNFQTHTVATR